MREYSSIVSLRPCSRRDYSGRMLMVFGRMCKRQSYSWVVSLLLLVKLAVSGAKMAGEDDGGERKISELAAP